MRVFIADLGCPLATYLTARGREAELGVSVLGQQ